MALTPNIGLTKPTVGADADVWGGQNNNNLDIIDTEINTLKTGAGQAMLKTGGTFTGEVTAPRFNGPVTGSVTGNADTATRLASARTFVMSGGPVRSNAAVFDGAGNINFTTTIADGALTIAMTAGLQAAISAKQDTLDADRTRKVTVSTSAPSGGVDGDIWLQVDA